MWPFSHLKGLVKPRSPKAEPKMFLCSKFGPYGFSAELGRWNFLAMVEATAVQLALAGRFHQEILVLHGMYSARGSIVSEGF
jgi:hypothetical protein